MGCSLRSLQDEGLGLGSSLEEQRGDREWVNIAPRYENASRESFKEEWNEENLEEVGEGEEDDEHNHDGHYSDYPGLQPDADVSELPFYF